MFAIEKCGRSITRSGWNLSKDEGHGGEGLNFDRSCYNRLKHGVQIMSQTLSWSALVYFLCINQTVLCDGATAAK